MFMARFFLMSVRNQIVGEDSGRLLILSLDFGIFAQRWTLIIFQPAISLMQVTALRQVAKVWQARCRGCFEYTYLSNILIYLEEHFVSHLKPLPQSYHKNVFKSLPTSPGSARSSCDLQLGRSRWRRGWCTSAASWWSRPRSAINTKWKRGL